MKYLEVNFIFKPDSTDFHDILAASIAEIGFESFQETDKGLAGYIQADIMSTEALNQSIEEFPIPNVEISFSISEVEDKNWNEEWEQSGFEPIIVGNDCIIYDAKQEVPKDYISTNNPTPISVAIDARQAFGTGTHQTTQMVVASLLEHNLKGKRVLDCGCGTGILSIVAAKCGASEVVAYDIDDWSVRNTEHNAKLNNVEIEVLEGDRSVLSHISGVFDMVMANINRNILLSDMEELAGAIAHPGWLIISGFYSEDTHLLIEKASEFGLKEYNRKIMDNWCCLTLYTNAH